MSDSTRDLIVRGIAAAKAGDKAEARFYLDWALRGDPEPDQRADACLWLSEISHDPKEKRDYLERILAENMANPLARRKLAVLDGRLDPAEIVADPDRLPAPSRAPAGPAKAQSFVCPTCGGRMTYTADGQSLVCEYCDRRREVARPAGAAGAVDEQDFVVALATAKGHRPPVTTRAFQCGACGAAFVLAPETLSLTCPYCESAYVIETAETRDLIPPAGVIPFGLSQPEASHALARWLAGHADAPEQTPPVHGLYVPAWTFDIQLEMRWQRTRHDGYDLRTETGEEALFYDDVVAAASRNLPGPLAEELRHYRLDALVPYDPAYLAAWPAEAYTLAAADASLDARSAALERARSAVAARVAEVTEVEVSLSNLFVTSFKLVLLPAWLAHYPAQGKQYTVVVNGQTGAVRGERPAGSARKVWNWLVGEA